MPTQPAISDISHLIALSVAPVFLLAGVGSVLGVMAARLSRIVDRARVVEGVVLAEPDSEGPLHLEMLMLERRARVISRSIALCTLTLLLVCTVIALMFLSALFSFDTATAVAVLFISAMLAFICALTLLFREIMLATAALRFGPILK
ncbi:DUF2721 domain-containing protein [uncultured Thiodictyon sp.]|uniref:DUF2721 domain-containing protein n=1 Tax=uncultured Thiodictyon sp. TaxID=1846217 RepID=UPI0025EF8BFF|nr:DUF2721 domain-containing protein [uncultured Thiodictyon sp.]